MASDYPPTPPFQSSGWHGLPSGSVICSVRSFSPSELTLPVKWCIYPSIDASNRHPVLTSLIRHGLTGKLALFDLGLSKSWESFLVPNDSENYDMFEVEVKADLDDVLEEGGIKAADIDLLILSYHHFDHTGNPALFPNAEIIVGPTELKPIKALEDQHGRATELVVAPLFVPNRRLRPLLRRLLQRFFPPRLRSRPHARSPRRPRSHFSSLVRLPQRRVCPPRRRLRPPPSPPLRSHRRRALHSRTLARARRLSRPHPPPRSNYEDFQLASATLEKVKYCNEREEIMVVLAHDFVQWKRWGGGKDGWAVELNGWRERGLKSSGTGVSKGSEVGEERKVWAGKAMAQYDSRS